MQTSKHYETLTKIYFTETDPSHWGDVSHGGQHRNATMLDLGCTTSLEVLHASVGCETCWIPKSDWGLHTEFILKGAQRRISVVGPVSPGASGQAILRTAHQTRQRTNDSRVSKEKQKTNDWMNPTKQITE